MKKIHRIALGVVLSTAVAVTAVVPQALANATTGVASWYGPGFHGRLTANGERYDMHDMTAAHKTLKFGTTVKVTNQNNGKSVTVRINDRGPFVGGRVIDLSRSAAAAIDMIGPGTAPVTIEIVG